MVRYDGYKAITVFTFIVIVIHTKLSHYKTTLNIFEYNIESSTIYSRP